MWNVLHVAFTAILYSDVASDFFTDGDDDDDEDDEDNEEDNGDFSFSDMGSDDDDDDDGDDIDDDALFELLWSSYMWGKTQPLSLQISYFIRIFIMNTG